MAPQERDMMRDYKIIAVDFDGTLCVNRFPEIGEPNFILVEILRELRKQGHKVILWSCREGSQLDDAVGWCKTLGLEFDAINQNIPETIEVFGSDCRKVYADTYLDDRNETPPGMWYMGMKPIVKEVSRGK